MSTPPPPLQPEPTSPEVAAAIIAGAEASQRTATMIRRVITFIILAAVIAGTGFLYKIGTDANAETDKRISCLQAMQVGSYYQSQECEDLGY